MRKDQNEIVSSELRVRQTVLGKRFNPNKKVPNWLFPSGIQVEYAKRLLEYVAAIEQVFNQTVLPHIKSLTEERDATLPRQDSYPENAERLIETMRLNIKGLPFNATFVAQDIGQKTNEWNDTQWRKVMRGVVGVEPFTQEPWLNDLLNGFTKENVSLIKNLSETTIEQIDTTVQRGLKNGDRWNSIAFEIIGDSSAFRDLQRREQDFLKRGIKQTKGKSIFAKTKNRAKLIARDQVAKLNSQLSKNRQTGLGIETYFWRTSQDERVRKKHHVLNGKPCRWDDATVYSDDGGKTWKSRSDIGGTMVHPGVDVLCRCTAEPNFAPIMEGL